MGDPHRQFRHAGIRLEMARVICNDPCGSFLLPRSPRTGLSGDAPSTRHRSACRPPGGRFLTVEGSSAVGALFGTFVPVFRVRLPAMIEAARSCCCSSPQEPAGTRLVRAVRCSATHSGRPPACRNHGVLWVLRLSALARPGPEPIDRSGSVGSAKRSSTMLRDNRGEGLHRIK
jgi:hypothetical protein